MSLVCYLVSLLPSPFWPLLWSDKRPPPTPPSSSSSFFTPSSPYEAASLWAPILYFIMGLGGGESLIIAAHSRSPPILSPLTRFFSARQLYTLPVPEIVTPQVKILLSI